MVTSWTHLIALLDGGLFAVPAWVAEEFKDRPPDGDDARSRSGGRLLDAITYLRTMYDIEDPRSIAWAGTADDAVKLIMLGKAYSRKAHMPVNRIVLPERRDLAPGEWTRRVLAAPVDNSGEKEQQRETRFDKEEPDEEARLLARYLALYGMRNTMIEDLHAGRGPGTQTGDYADVEVHTPAGVIPWARVSRITDPEMRALMLDVETQLAGLLQEVLRRERTGSLGRLLTRIRRDHFGPGGISWDRPSRPGSDDRKSTGAR